MGKRELLLIVVFLVLGGVVYQVTAPAAPDQPGRRSWSDALREVRAEMFGPRARYPVDVNVAVPVGADVETLDIGEIGGRVEIVGEQRDTIEGTAHATLVGENEEDVKAAAAGLKVETEEDGSRLRLRLAHPDTWRLGRHGRPAVDLRLKVPARLVLSLAASGVVEVEGVAGVALDTARGNVSLRKIAGPVTGEQRDGMLEVTGAQRLDLQTRRVNVRVTDVTGEVDIEAIDGGLEAKGLKGTTTLDTRRVGVRLDDQTGRLEIEGQDGRVELRGLAAELTFDGTRLPLLVEMAAAVPVSVEAREASVDLRLPAAGVTLKVQAEEGSVQLPPDLPEAVREGVTSSTEAKVRGGGPLVSLTGVRTAITVKAP